MVLAGPNSEDIEGTDVLAARSDPTAVDSLSTVDVADLSSGVTTTVLAGKERLLGRPSAALRCAGARRTRRCPSCRCAMSGRRLLACAASGVAAALVAGDRQPAAIPAASRVRAGRSRWIRTNHAGPTGHPRGGPDRNRRAAGRCGGGPAAGPLGSPQPAPWPSPVSDLGSVGAYDDLYGASQAKGFRGHLRALRPVS